MYVYTYVCLSFFCACVLCSKFQSTCTTLVGTAGMDDNIISRDGWPGSGRLNLLVASKTLIFLVQGIGLQIHIISDFSISSLVVNAYLK